MTLLCEPASRGEAAGWWLDGGVSGEIFEFACAERTQFSAAADGLGKELSMILEMVLVPLTLRVCRSRADWALNAAMSSR